MAGVFITLIGIFINNITHTGKLQEAGNKHKFETATEMLHGGDEQRHLSPQLEVHNHI